MRHLSYTVVRAVLVLLGTLAACAGTAGATTMTISPGGAITSASVGKLSFSGSGMTVRCNVTLSGSLSRGPIELARGRTFGSTREVQFGACEGGTASTVLVLPLTDTFNSILGTAASAITGILYSQPNFAVLFSLLGGFINCLYEGVLDLLAVTTAVAGTREPWRYTSTDETFLGTSYPLIRGGLGCPSEGSWFGTFHISPTQTIIVR